MNLLRYWVWKKKKNWGAIKLNRCKKALLRNVDLIVVAWAAHKWPAAVFLCDPPPTPPPPIPIQIITLVIYKCPEDKCNVCWDFPWPPSPLRSTEHTISHYISEALQGQEDLIAAYHRPKKLLPNSASFTMQVFTVVEFLYVYVQVIETTLLLCH